MKKILFLLFIGLSLSAQKTTTMVSINLSESHIHWLGKKITGQHEGKIDLLSGTLIMDNGLLMGGDFVVDMSSLAATDLNGKSAKKLEES